MNAVEALHYGLVDEILGDTDDLVGQPGGFLPLALNGMPVVHGFGKY
jgi:hypothetical protein